MESLDFLDFELEITSDEDGRYTVAVVHSPAGEARGSFDLPFGSLELENYVLNLQNALLRAGNQRRRVLTPEAETVQEFGSLLFDALFFDEIKSLYAVSRREASRRGAGLRIKLRIGPGELAALPWEFLYDPRREEYICLSRNTPIVRYLSLPRPVRALAVTPPLRILGMVASPSDQEPLDVALEQERLKRALHGLEEQGLVILDWLEGQTWRDLQQALYQNQYHVFHFIGHGYFDEAREEGAVLFVDRQGRSRHFSATDLARLLADQTTLRLVVLNSCEGAKAGEYDVFSSTAATLVRRGIPAVIAMQYDITDDAAIQMAETFYQALAGGLPVDAALSEARKAITFALQNSLEWGTPVLFMRTEDGRIFDIENDAQLASGGTIPPPSQTAATARPEPAPPVWVDEDETPRDDVISEKSVSLAKPAAAAAGATQPSTPPVQADKGAMTAEDATSEKAASLAEPVAAAAGTSQPPRPVSAPRDWGDLKPTPESVSGAQGSGRKRSKAWLFLPVIAVILALVYWWPNIRPEPSLPEEAPPAETAVEIPATTPTPQTVKTREFGDIPFVYVSAGEFIMGSTAEQVEAVFELCGQYYDSCERGWFEPEQPQHTVFLDDYWIMQTEVTNAQYAGCVAADLCREPDNDLWNDGTYSDHPVTGVSWSDAVTYAEWLSGGTGRTMRLPTEAEWEKAARGVDGRIYPWDDDWDWSLTNYCDRNCEFDWKDESGNDGFARTAPVGSYLDGASPYGALDMAGNVWEWTADWYDSGYYTSSPDRNPQGPETTDLRVVRGGSWNHHPFYVRVPLRQWSDPDNRSDFLGFRLASPGF